MLQEYQMYVQLMTKLIGSLPNTMGYHIAFYHVSGSTVRTSDISWFSLPLLLQNGRTETGHTRRNKCRPRLFCVFNIFQIDDGYKVPTE